ncbi:MAG: hypothetical protein RBU25_07420 [Lentisphaeria bacterium]|jgi:hypothetical protein|nr:hypothetical protein [Lentisphaeria bacterium]
MPRKTPDYSSIKSLVEAVSADQDATSALYLLAADYFSAKSRLAESNRDTGDQGVRFSAVDVLQKVSQDLAWSLTALKSISGNAGDLPVNLLAAQMEMRHAKASVDEALQHYKTSSDSEKQCRDRQPGESARELLDEDGEGTPAVLVPETA